MKNFKEEVFIKKLIRVYKNAIKSNRHIDYHKNIPK